MRQIQLSNGMTAQVDDCVFDCLSRFKWRACGDHRTYYACRNEKQADGTWAVIAMHHEVMRLAGTPTSLIDHRDCNGLNNQRDNLRAATPAGNSRNRRGWGKSGLKGVYRNYRLKQWDAAITVNRKYMKLGTFPTKEEAARAYDAAAVEHFGEFARLNFPQTSLEAPKAVEHFSPEPGVITVIT